MSHSSLVALFFAFSWESDSDGEILVFDDRGDDLTDNPIWHVVAEPYLFVMDTFTQLSVFYDDVVLRPYFSSQGLLNSERTAREKALWIKECCGGPMLAMASKTLDRQVAQAAYYLLFPNVIDGDGEGACFGKRI